MKMLRTVAVAALCLACATAGYSWARWGGAYADFEIAVPFDVRAAGNRISAGESLGCKALAGAHISEDRVATQKIYSRGKIGTDTAAIKINADGRTIQFQTAADLRAGGTEPAEMRVLHLGPKLLVAARSNGADTVTIVLDLESGNALWSYAGLSFPGLMGETNYLRCR